MEQKRRSKERRFCWDEGHAGAGTCCGQARAPFLRRWEDTSHPNQDRYGENRAACTRCGRYTAAHRAERQNALPCSPDVLLRPLRRWSAAPAPHTVRMTVERSRKKAVQIHPRAAPHAVRMAVESVSSRRASGVERLWSSMSSLSATRAMNSPLVGLSFLP